MRRFCWMFALLLLLPQFIEARSRVQGWCQDGGVSVTVPGTLGSGTQKFQRSFPSCTVTVYNAGLLTMPTIYSDNAGTTKANPFVAASSGRWFFYVDTGRYDIKFSGGGIATPFTLPDFSVWDMGSYVGSISVTGDLTAGGATSVGTDLTVGGYSAFCGSSLHGTVATGYVGIFCDKLWTNTDNEVRGIHATVRNKRTTADGAWDFFALSGAVEVATGNTQHITGQMKGVVGELYFQAGAYTVDKAIGIQSNIPTLGAGVTVTDWYGLAVNAPPAGGTITNGRGLWIENLNANGNAPTNSYAIQIDGIANYGRIKWPHATIQESPTNYLELNATTAIVTVPGLFVGAAGSQGVAAGSYAIGGATIIDASQNVSITGNMAATGTTSHFITKKIATPASASAGSIRIYAATADGRLYTKDELGNVIGPLGLTFIAVENGANNAIACAAASGPTLATGLRVSVLLAHTLQVGANTFAYNGGGATNIKSHRNVANNIGTAYAVGGIIELSWDGTQWQDMSQ